MKLYREKDYLSMCRRAAGVMSAQIILKPDCVLGLATGSTPIGVYEKLAEAFRQGDIDFGAVTSFNLDEYCGLSPENPQSYRYFMNEHLFSKVNIDITKTYVPNGTAADYKVECERYERLIAEAGGIDLQLLGIGGNGHIGFNEPASVFMKATHCVTLDEGTISANARFFDNPDEVPRKALTMGIGTIMFAKKILLIANGEAKKEIVEKTLYGHITPEVPASILQLHPDVTVIFSEN